MFTQHFEQIVTRIKVKSLAWGPLPELRLRRDTRLEGEGAIQIQHGVRVEGGWDTGYLGGPGHSQTSSDELEREIPFDVLYLFFRGYGGGGDVGYRVYCNMLRLEGELLLV